MNVSSLGLMADVLRAIGKWLCCPNPTAFLAVEGLRTGPRALLPSSNGTLLGQVVCWRTARLPPYMLVA